MLARQLRRPRAHRPRQADDLGGPLALHRQADEQAGDLRRLRPAVHDLVHRRRRLLHGEVLPPLQLLDQRGEHAQLQEIAQELPAFARQHRLGMKLHAVHRERAVAQAHDRAVLGAARHLERLGQRFGDDERVIAAGDERLRDAPEDARARRAGRTTSCRASAAARARPAPPKARPMPWCPRQTPSTRHRRPEARDRRPP